jgi:hypothetical protein
LRAGYAVIQFNAAYAKLVETTELEQKLQLVQDIIDAKAQNKTYR